MMAARVLAQSRWPYVSTLLFAVQLVEVAPAHLSTIGVDRGWRLYYSPDFVMACTPDQLATVLLHECQHLMLDHAGRFDALKQPKERHPIWNLAGDVVINHTLDRAGMPWPAERGIRYADLAHRGVTEGMTTEAAYFAMLATAGQGGGGDGDQPGGSDGSQGDGPRPGRGDVPRAGRGDDDATGEGLDDDDATGDGQGPAQGQDRNSPGPGGGVLRGGCGSGAGGDPADYERPADDAGAPEIGHAQRDLVRDRVAQDVLARQKAVGDVPAGLARWAEELLNPTVDWRSVLAGLIRSALASRSGRRDFSYRVPSRRTEGLRPALAGAVLPAMRQPPPPSVAAVLDTSGSISADELRAFLTEVLHIVRSVGVSGGVMTIPCDARAYPMQRIRRQADALGAQLPGGGGTDMRVGLVAACSLRPLPDVVVVFTDGHTPWPTSPPHPATSFVVAVIAGNGATAPEGPLWAQRVVVNEVSATRRGGRSGR
jgi:predicted metal-dependent peptidase